MLYETGRCSGPVVKIHLRRKYVVGTRGVGPVDKVTSPGGRFMKIYSREQENKKKVRRHIHENN